MSSASEDKEAVQLLIRKLGVQRHEKLKEHMKSVVQSFKDRTLKYRDIATRPETPTSDELKRLDQEVEELRKAKVLKVDDFSEYAANGPKRSWFMLPHAIHPQGKLMLLIMGIQTMTFLYNAWVVPLRFAFHIYQNPSNKVLWLFADYLADFIYIFDTVVLKTRVMFLDGNGIYQSNRRDTIKNYVRSPEFKMDLLSLLPLDLLYFFTGFNGRWTILRLPRFLRFYNFPLFFDRLDAFLPFPVFVRLFRTVNIMLYLIHINTCAFYAFSDYDGIDTSTFVFNGHGHAYIRCFYIALKTSISVGINPKPLRDRPLQMVFMGSLWLSGVFVFAVLIGNVKDIIGQSTRNQDQYVNKFDQISQYMYSMNVPEYTRNRVKEWCQYTWRTQKSFDELAILEVLPVKMRTDVALNVHYETLKNVKLFHGCDPGLIKELVVKLRPIIFLPGDYICKKGDVGKEMFIIAVGQVQVVGGPDDSIIFVTLGSGVCFGEIALLGSGQMNRRTANVRAYGFTTLYVLYKDDLTEALEDFPEDKALLGRKARKAAIEVAANRNADKPKAEEQGLFSLTKDIIFEPHYTPALYRTIRNIISSSSKRKGSNVELKKIEKSFKIEDEIVIVAANKSE